MFAMYSMCFARFWNSSDMSNKTTDGMLLKGNCMRTTFKRLMLFLSLVLIPGPAWSSQEPYLQVATHFLNHTGSSATIEQVREIKTNLLAPSTKKVLSGWILELEPAGYLLIAASRNHMPVKAYSLTSTYQTLPEAYKTFLLKELELHVRHRSATSQARQVLKTVGADRAKQAWDFLLNDDPQTRVQSYAPGTALLESTWDQRYPFNAFLPKMNGQTVVTGCVNTALAQIMRYHEHPSQGRGLVSSTWNGRFMRVILNRPYYWRNMPTDMGMNALDHEQVEVALLMKDLAVLNKTDFGLQGSTATFQSHKFIQHFGYSNQIASKTNQDPDFFQTLQQEIDLERPVLLSLPGHMTVVDGFTDDPTGQWFHVNMGWGGHNDDFYNLDAPIETTQYSFDPDLDIYYNIRPCSGTDCVYPELVDQALPPQIMHPPADLVLGADPDKVFHIRIDARDPNDDPLVLDCSNTNPRALNATLSGQILSVQPKTGSSGQAARIVLTSTSGGERDQADLTVLLSTNQLDFGEDFRVSGCFSDKQDIDAHEVYLQGNCTLSGDRGYTNQAFFIRALDQEGALVQGFTDEPMTAYFDPGIYSLQAGLSSGTWHYTYTAGTDDEYTIQVSCPEFTKTTAQLAGLLQIDLAGISPSGDLNLDGQVNLDDAVLGLQTLSGLNPDGMDHAADINGDKRIGLPEIIDGLKRLSEDPNQSI